MIFIHSSFSHLTTHGPSLTTPAARLPSLFSCGLESALGLYLRYAPDPSALSTMFSIKALRSPGFQMHSFPGSMGQRLRMSSRSHEKQAGEQFLRMYSSFSSHLPLAAQYAQLFMGASMMIKSNIESPASVKFTKENMAYCS